MKMHSVLTPIQFRSRLSLAIVYCSNCFLHLDRCRIISIRAGRSIPAPKLSYICTSHIHAGSSVSLDIHQQSNPIMHFYLCPQHHHWQRREHASTLFPSQNVATPFLIDDIADSILHQHHYHLHKQSKDRDSIPHAKRRHQKKAPSSSIPSPQPPISTPPSSGDAGLQHHFTMTIIPVRSMCRA